MLQEKILQCNHSQQAATCQQRTGNPSTLAITLCEMHKHLL